MRTPRGWLPRVLCVVAAVLLFDGSTSAMAISPGNRIPWQGGSWYLNGADYPWVHYGNDFGGNAWGAYGVHDPGTRAAVDADFARMEQQGIHSARWWLFADGRAGILWDGNGMPTGIDQYVLADLDAALAVAQKHHVYLELVLTDVSLIYKGSYNNGVQMGGRPYLVNTEAGQQALIANVFDPVFQRYGQNSQVLAYEVMNEPEWAIREDQALNPLATEPATLATFQNFTRRVAAEVHARTRSYVTMGGAAARWAQQWKGLGLDFYSIHFYDWMHPWADVDLYGSGCAGLHLDAPVVVGEYAAGSATASFQQYLDRWFQTGCAGAWAWSFDRVDAAGGPDPGVMAAWNSAHAAVTNPPPGSIPPPPPQPSPTPTPPPAPAPGPGSAAQVRFNFEDGGLDGWQVNWGGHISLRNSTVPHDASHRALQVRVGAARDWPAIDVQTRLEGLRPGKQVTYQVWAPAGARLTVTPYATDSSWQERFVTTSQLAPGWNQVTWQVPQVDGIRAIGLQLNDDSSWGGRIYLDSVAW
jgi:hypothetical protein